MINKHFPADTTLNYNQAGELIKTFLNDPKIDAELYSYLLVQSIGENSETRTYKKFLMTTQEIAEKVLHKKSRKTVTTHLKYLIENNYIQDKGEYYLLLNPEKMYFKVPQELLSFLLNTVQEPVIKTYIYLGQRNNYKPEGYIFTVKELCEHLGLSYAKNYKAIKDYLIILTKLELIDYEIIYQNKLPYMKLTKFSVDCPKGKEKWVKKQ